MVLIWLEKESVRSYIWVHQKSNQENYINISRNWIMAVFHFLPLYNIQNSLQCLKYEKPLKMIATEQISKIPSLKLKEISKKK